VQNLPNLFGAWFVTAHSAHHQLGRFIVAFQPLEPAVNDVMKLSSGDDCGVPRILVNYLEYSKRLGTADVLFAHFVPLRHNVDQTASRIPLAKVELRNLGERRNDMVHSRYYPWVDD